MNVRERMVREPIMMVDPAPSAGRGPVLIGSPTSSTTRAPSTMLSTSFGRSCNTTRSIVIGLSHVSRNHAPPPSPFDTHSRAGCPGAPPTIPSTAALTLVRALVVDAAATANGATFKLPEDVPQLQSAWQPPGQAESSPPSQRSVG